MKKDRFQEITRRYSSLRVALVGDFSLDRYLEIDPEKPETSIETGLPVHNVIRVRGQPGSSGTIL
ncbi:MAG: carbohydrate kinase, partial [Verrucomicrobia bacterium]|nr:carbohydrate kinase [Verrucomicrobiota bacterium]